VNDVSGLMWDEEMAATCAELKCGLVLMHTRGRPEEWSTLPLLVDPVGTVKTGLAESASKALAAGVESSRIVLDPGFGFGKKFEENYPLLARFGELHELGYPLMAGTSRKGFLGRTLAHDGIDASPEHRLNATLASSVIAVMAGAHIVRVHDVAECIEAVKIADAVRGSIPV
jgi:dihydropteroate synthase